MNRKRLKTKDSKTEFIRPMLGYAVQLRKCITNAIHIEEEIIQRSMQIKYLAAQLDQNMNFKPMSPNDVNLQC